jgi:hypothetical protein
VIEARAIIAQERRDRERMAVETAATFDELHELLADYRLFLVRDVVNTVVAAEATFTRAHHVCETIADRNSRPLRVAFPRVPRREP